MPNNDHLKSARQMIDDLINDDPEASKQSFHDFLKAKTIARLNPELENDSDEEYEEADDTELDDEDVSMDDGDEVPDVDEEDGNNTEDEE